MELTVAPSPPIRKAFFRDYAKNALVHVDFSMRNGGQDAAYSTIPTARKARRISVESFTFVKSSVPLAGEVTGQFRSAGLPRSQFATFEYFSPTMVEGVDPTSSTPMPRGANELLSHRQQTCPLENRANL